MKKSNVIAYAEAGTQVREWKYQGRIPNLRYVLSRNKFPESTERCGDIAEYHSKVTALSLKLTSVLVNVF